VISTEDKIEIKASKKIVLIAGGSQIEISSGGVLPTTAGKFESKAGQHKFVGGEMLKQLNIHLPVLNNSSKNKYSILFNVIEDERRKNQKYIILNKDFDVVQSGDLPKNNQVYYESEGKPEDFNIHIFNDEDFNICE